eukprot:8362143-Pyramimonas_sp.AAC.1
MCIRDRRRSLGTHRPHRERLPHSDGEFPRLHHLRSPSTPRSRGHQRARAAWALTPSRRRCRVLHV